MLFLKSLISRLSFHTLIGEELKIRPFDYAEKVKDGNPKGKRRKKKCCINHYLRHTTLQNWWQFRKV